MNITVYQNYQLQLDPGKITLVGHDNTDPND